MKTHTKPETMPCCCKKPTLVPTHFRAQVKADIEADVMKGILERVPAGEHDTWCSRMAIQAKKSTEEDSWPFLPQQAWARWVSPRSSAKRFPGNKYKSTMGCVDGYHGIDLAEENRHKTTFATEWGKFRYKRAPQVYFYLDTATAGTRTPSWRTARIENKEIIWTQTKCVHGRPIFLYMRQVVLALFLLY